MFDNVSIICADFYFVLCTDKLIYATESSGFLRSGQRYSVNKNYNLHDLLFVVPDDDNDINRSIFICSKDKGSAVYYVSCYL